MLLRAYVMMKSRPTDAYVFFCAFSHILETRKRSRNDLTHVSLYVWLFWKCQNTSIAIFGALSLQLLLTISSIVWRSDYECFS